MDRYRTRGFAPSHNNLSSKLHTLRTQTQGTMRGKNQHMTMNRHATMKGKPIDVKATMRTLTGKLPPMGQLVKFLEVPDETFNDCYDRVTETFPELSPDEQIEKAKSDSTNEWVGCNILDFYNQVTTIYGLVEDYHIDVSSLESYKLILEGYVQATDEATLKNYPYPAFNHGFPPEVQYKLKEKRIDDQKYTGQRYVHWTLVWIEEQVFQRDLFPETESDVYPPEFFKIMSDIMKRMFRVYAIMLSILWPFFKEHSGDSELVDCFKHFYFFAKKWDMIDEAEKRVFQPQNKKFKLLFSIKALDKDYEEELAIRKKFEIAKQQANDEAKEFAKKHL